MAGECPVAVRREKVIVIVLFLSSMPPCALSFSLQRFSSIKLPVSRQVFLAGSPAIRTLAPSVQSRFAKSSGSTLMVGFGASKGAAGQGSKINKGKSTSGGSGSSFPPAMLKKFKQLKDEGCLVVKVYARVRGDSMASPGPWHEVNFEYYFC